MAEECVKYVASLLRAAMLRPLQTSKRAIQWYVLLITAHIVFNWLDAFTRDLPIFKKNITAMFSACKGCGLIPIHGTLNDHGLCCGCHDKRKCRMCRQYLDPHLYSDGDGSICKAGVKMSTKRGGTAAYKALRDTTGEHVIDGGVEHSLEFFIYFSDKAIRRILQDAIDMHKYV